MFTRVLLGSPTKPHCNRYEWLSLDVLWCLWLHERASGSWADAAACQQQFSKVKYDPYVLKRLLLRRIALPGHERWADVVGWSSCCGRMPVVELLFPLDPAEGDVCVTCTRTLVVNRCTFLLLTLFYSMWRLAFTIYSFFICNMLSQMWINQLTPDVFIQLLHVKGNSYVNMMCLCIIFISSVSCNKSRLYLVYSHWLTFCTKCDTLHWDCATEITVSTTIFNIDYFADRFLADHILFLFVQ